MTPSPLTPPAQKKKKPNYGYALGGTVGTLGLGAAALGGIGVGVDKGLSNNELGLANKIGDMSHRTDQGAVLDYADRASAAAKNIKPFGMPINKFMQTARRDLGIGEKWQPDSWDHYSEFMKGPVPAYMQLMAEDGKPSPQAQIPTTSHHLGVDTLNNVRNSMKEYGISKNTLNYTEMPHEKQVQFLKDYDGWLKTNNPELWQRKTTWEKGRAQWIPHAAKGYGEVAKKIGKLKDFGRSYGMPLMIGGAGLAGLAGLGMYLNKRKKDKEAQLTASTAPDPTTGTLALT